MDAAHNTAVRAALICCLIAVAAAHARPRAPVHRQRGAATARAAVRCRSNLSDEEIETLRAEYADWISRDPEVREPYFWKEVERARQRAEKGEKANADKEKLVAEQLSALLEVLSIWQAFSGIPFVTSDKRITAAGWALTAFAALAPVAVLQYVSNTSRGALSALVDTGPRHRPSPIGF